MKKTSKYIIIGIFLVGLSTLALFVISRSDKPNEKESIGDDEQIITDQSEDDQEIYKSVYLTANVKIVFPSETKEVTVQEECPEVGGANSLSDSNAHESCYCHPVIDFINSALNQLNIDSEILENSINRIDSFSSGNRMDPLSSNQQQNWEVYINGTLSPYTLDKHCIENGWEIELRYE